MKLMPSCSEIVCRLNGKMFSVWTDGFPNGCMDQMMEILEEMEIPEEVELEYVDNNGGGGDWGYVENCLLLAKKAIKKNLSPEVIAKQDERLWNGEEVESELQTKIK